MWQQLPRENYLLTPNSTEDGGNNGTGAGPSEEDFSSMLRLSLPESYPGSQHDDDWVLQDLPLPGEDELMELLDATPSECNSNGGFNFKFTTSHVEKHARSPNSGQCASITDQCQQRQESLDPRNYNLVGD